MSVELMECRALLSGLSYSLTTDQSVYQAGQPIEMTFTATNTSDGPETLIVGAVNSGFVVTQGSQAVWQSNAGVNPMDLVDETLNPGQSWSTHSTWDGTITDGTSTTTATGSFVVTNQLDPAGASASFQIQSPIAYSLGSPPASSPFGQPIPFSYTVTNTGDQPVTFNQGATDFVVTSTNNGQVWESDAGASSQPPTSQTLQPGQSLTETATWNGVANEGTPAGTDVWNDFSVSVLGAPAGTSQPFAIGSPLALNVATDRPTYQIGQAVQMTATETNTSDQAVTILNANDQFTVLGYDGVTLPAQEVSSSNAVVTLQPGQSQTFTATWDTSGIQASSSPSPYYSVSFQDNFQGAGSPQFAVEPAPSPVATPNPPAPTPNPPAPTPTSPVTIPNPPVPTPTSPVATPNPPVPTPPGGLTGSSSGPLSGSSASPVPTPSPTAQTQPDQVPSPVAATLTASPLGGRHGEAVRIKLTLRNDTGKSVSLAPSSRTAEITVLDGSRIISSETKDLFKAKAATLKAGRSLRLSTVWSGPVTQADLSTLDPGTYTIEVDAGGYTASTSIQLGSPPAVSKAGKS